MFNSEHGVGGVLIMGKRGIYGVREYMGNLCPCPFILSKILMNLKLFEILKEVKEKRSDENNTRTVSVSCMVTASHSCIGAMALMDCPRLLSATLAKLTSGSSSSVMAAMF